MPGGANNGLGWQFCTGRCPRYRASEYLVYVGHHKICVMPERMPKRLPFMR